MPGRGCARFGTNDSPLSSPRILAFIMVLFSVVGVLLLSQVESSPLSYLALFEGDSVSKMLGESAKCLPAYGSVARGRFLIEVNRCSGTQSLSPGWEGLRTRSCISVSLNLTRLLFEGMASPSSSTGADRFFMADRGMSTTFARVLRRLGGQV